ARIIAQTLAIPDVRAAVSPVGKAEVVRALEGSGKKVLMVGDGINDAPALTEASIGMAVGGANDIALESADAVMLREDLMLVPRVLELTRRTYRVIRQNLFWAFAYNMLAVPLAITGWLHPIMAAGAMALSSLTVVGNSLRLHRH
ncbi:MAG: HAD-IC family P-type ATPase, partial [Thermodesulfobacteriota bacterium]